VVGRTVYALSGYNTTGVGGPVTAVPGTSPVVACSYQGLTGRAAALLQNGDAWDYNTGSWTLRGNVFGSPTPAAHATWGQLKTNYHK
jgi:hypothetical protein